MFLNLFLVFIIHDCWMTYIYVYSRIKQRMFQYHIVRTIGVGYIDLKTQYSYLNGCEEPVNQSWDGQRAVAPTSPEREGMRTISLLIFFTSSFNIHIVKCFSVLIEICFYWQTIFPSIYKKEDKFFFFFCLCDDNHKFIDYG